MTLEKRFISHYMLVEPIQQEESFCCWAAEEMRSNKSVWILEYFADGDGHINEHFHIASEVKNISHIPIVRLLDVFTEENNVYIVTEIPKSKVLMTTGRFDPDWFYTVGENLLRAFVLLQRNGIGLKSLSLNNVFVNEIGDIQLYYGEVWSLKGEKESRENEIIVFGTILLEWIIAEKVSAIEISREYLKNKVPEKLYPLFEEIFIDRKTKRFEALSHYFQEKKGAIVDSVIDTDELERPAVYRFVRYVILALAMIVVYMMFTPIQDISKSSRFDIWRYQVLGNIGLSDPQRILGEIYEKGYGVEPDMDTSIAWYRKAAQSGNVYAQMSLGHFYDAGIGIPADRKQALYWFTLAATNGDELAKKNVEVLQDNLKTIAAESNKPKLEVIPVIERNISNDVDIKMKSVSKKEPIVVKNEEAATAIPETIREKKTVNDRIMWQDNEDNVKLKLTWNEAMDYCLNLKLNGYNDWYLPDKETLFQLFFEQRDLNYHSEDLYWSSTQETDLTAWRVYFDYTGGKNRLSLTSKSKNDRWNVRCYRKVQ